MHILKAHALTDYAGVPVEIDEEEKQFFAIGIQQDFRYGCDGIHLFM